MDKEELIKYSLAFIRSSLLTNLDRQDFLFLMEHYSPFDRYKINNSDLDMVWIDRGRLIELEKPYRGFTHKYRRNFTLKGKICFESLDSGALIEKDFLENLFVEVNLDFQESAYNFTIYNEEKRLLKIFNDKVIETTKKYNLIGFDDQDLKIDNKSLFSFYIDIIRKKRTSSFPKPFQDFNFYHDLTRVTQDIRFLTGQLILYKPHITNYLSGKTDWHGQTIFKYFPSIFDKRYFMTSGLIISLLYNYWDKIGDLLDNCFDVIAKNRHVYFGTVIKDFPNQYHNSSNYIWLKDFKDNEFQDLLGKRNEIVHFTAIESQYFEQYQDNFRNEQEIQNLQEEKEKIVKYLINHNQLIFTGFEKAIKLIDEIQ